MSSKSIAFHHFGCKVNFAEASALSRQFRENGFRLLDFHEKADIYVISTCVVTAVAEKKCRAAIRQAHKLNPDARIAVIGCFPELKPGEIGKMDGVSLVLGHAGKFMLFEKLEQLIQTDPDSNEYHGGLVDQSVGADVQAFVPSYSYGDRTRSFLKIQDGCDYFCSYCTIPLARGRSRSDTISNTLKNAREIVSNGILEVVLTGVNIGDFGRQNGEDFLQLIKELEQVEGLSRIRISSIEPDLLSDQIIRFVASSGSFLPHFHIPLQSGCNRTLKAMQRKYTREHYASRVAMIRTLMPFACIAADVIVGFPGETDEDFSETLDFLSECDISYLHVFTYSKRENTLAARSASPVSDTVKKKRSEMLHALSDLKKKNFYLGNLGRNVKVLFESDNSHGWMHGFSENYIKVKTPYNPILVNQIREVKLDRPDGDHQYLVTDIVNQ